MADHFRFFCKGLLGGLLWLWASWGLSQAQSLEKLAKIPELSDVSAVTTLENQLFVAESSGIISRVDLKNWQRQVLFPKGWGTRHFYAYQGQLFAIHAGDGNLYRIQPQTGQFQAMNQGKTFQKASASLLFKDQLFLANHADGLLYAIALHPQHPHYGKARPLPKQTDWRGALGLWAVNQRMWGITAEGLLLYIASNGKAFPVSRGYRHYQSGLSGTLGTLVYAVLKDHWLWGMDFGRATGESVPARKVMQLPPGLDNAMFVYQQQLYLISHEGEFFRLNLKASR